MILILKANDSTAGSVVEYMSVTSQRQYIRYCDFEGFHEGPKKRPASRGAPRGGCVSISSRSRSSNESM